MYTTLGSDTELGALFSDYEFLGTGTFGAVFKARQSDRKEVVLKFMYETSNQLDLLRECYIGVKLSALPVSAYFTGATHMYICNFEFPLTIRSIANAEAQSKLPAQLFYILLMPYSAGLDGHTWLSTQTAPVSGPVIQSIITQLVFALAYAQSEIGFQHNDLKLENLKFTPVPKEEARNYILKSNNDVFSFTIPKNGVVVEIIDFGASSLKTGTSVDVTSFIRTTESHTPDYVPFEQLLNATLMSQRENDGDYPSICKLALNLICHLRFKNWAYTLDEDASGVDFIPSFKYSAADIKLLKSGLKSNATADEYQVILSNILLMKELETVSAEPYIELLDKLSPTTKQMLTGVKTAVKLAFSDKYVEIGDVAVQFLSLLISPMQKQRLEFGVPDSPFGLANALYHPFIAFDTWSTDMKIISGTTVTEMLEAPLRFSSTATSLVRANVLNKDILSVEASFPAKIAIAKKTTKKPKKTTAVAQPPSAPAKDPEVQADNTIRAKAVSYLNDMVTIHNAILTDKDINATLNTITVILGNASRLVTLEMSDSQYAIFQKSWPLAIKQYGFSTKKSSASATRYTLRNAYQIFVSDKKQISVFGGNAKNISPEPYEVDATAKSENADPYGVIQDTCAFIMLILTIIRSIDETSTAVPAKTFDTFSKLINKSTGKRDTPKNVKAKFDSVIANFIADNGIADPIITLT